MRTGVLSQSNKCVVQQYLLKKWWPFSFLYIYIYNATLTKNELWLLWKKPLCFWIGFTGKPWKINGTICSAVQYYTFVSKLMNMSSLKCGHWDLFFYRATLKERNFMMACYCYWITYIWTGIQGLQVACELSRVWTTEALFTQQCGNEKPSPRWRQRDV